METLILRARYRRIVIFFSQVIAMVIWWDIILPRIGLRSWSRSTRAQRYQAVAVRFRTLAIKMGGVMIKVGQFLSSRLDVLPAAITDELAGLQDEVPPENFPDIRLVAEAELGAPLREVFDLFVEEPLAAASLGQVHRARLCLSTDEAKLYREVVVKVQRPHIEQLIEVDLSALRRVGSWLKRYRPISKRVDMDALIAEFSSIIHQEIDYLAEGSNAEMFQKQFLDDERVLVPRVVWSLTTKRVLTLEDVYAIKITDYDSITQAGIDRGEVARLLLATYLKQIFEDGFFHADPHPGNLFVTPKGTGEGEASPDWQLTFVDFGMAGSVPENLRQGLRELVIAVGMQDAGRVVKAYQLMGVLLPGADLKLIEQAEAQAFDRFWGMSMSELRQISRQEMRQFAHQFRDLMLSMPIQVPHNLILLVRTVAILSGMCTGLDADFNVWGELAPYARKLVSEQDGVDWRVWLDEAGEIVRNLLALPAQSSRVIALIERGEVKVQIPEVAQRVAYLEQAIYRLIASLFSMLFFGTAVLLYLKGELQYALAASGISVLLLLWMIFFTPVNWHRN